MRLSALDLADAGNISAVPFHPELEILVRIKPARIDSKLQPYEFLLGLELSGHLLDLDDNELRWFERSESDQNVYDAAD